MALGVRRDVDAYLGPERRRIKRGARVPGLVRRARSSRGERALGNSREIFTHLCALHVRAGRLGAVPMGRGKVLGSRGLHKDIAWASYSQNGAL